MAEKQAAHRQEMEKVVITANATNEQRGQLISGSLAALVLTGGLALVGLGREVAGFTLLVAETTTLAAIWLYGKRQQSKELSDKRVPLPEANRSSTTPGIVPSSVEFD